jgi:hypothetical protein
MTLILMVVALACFVLAAFGVSSRVGLVPLGLACWVLSIVLPALR